MALSPDSALLDIQVDRSAPDTVPSHHVVVKVSPSWSTYFSSWNSSPPAPRLKRPGNQGSSGNSSRSTSPSVPKSSSKVTRTGFKNPWPSWQKPTQKQIWDNLEWGEDEDPCIKLAASHLTPASNSVNSTRPSLPKRISSSSSRSIKEGRTRAQQAAQLLRVVEPDFDFDPASERAKTTWLGHAGVLVQLPPLQKDGRPLRCIFDPIFSDRSSPSQAAGPIRSYQPPCKIEALPPVDVYMLSHNHYDHLDYETVMSLWRFNRDWIRFIVPLGNKAWFVECGIDADRVTELDWWDSVQLSQPGSSSLKITCTPNQHNSGRSGLDADTTLWSSWYVEQPSPKPYKVFFAGDTGYQFHPSPSWPPPPPPPPSTGDNTQTRMNKKQNSVTEDGEFPACPAFQQITNRLGTPHLSLLPVAVGATFSFLRSYVPLPDSVSPFPRHSPGLTAANHMPPWDAVRVFRLMTSRSTEDSEPPPLAIAMHWGTFVPDRTEILKTLGALEWACDQHDVRFGRSLLDFTDDSTSPIFLALDHGQSVST